MNRIFYRAAVITQGAAGLPLMNVGYLTDAEQIAYTAEGASAIVVPQAIKSLGAAVSKLTALVRRFQAEGLDVRGEVLGLVGDDNVTNVYNSSNVASGKATPATPVRAMTNQEIAEQLYCRIDTPEKGLTTRINLSNRDANAGLPANLGGDFAEDAEDDSTNTV